MQLAARSILAIDMSPFGQSLSLLPAMRALRHAYPGVLLTAAAPTGTCQLLAASGLTDETIELGVIRFPVGGRGGGMKRLLNLLRHSRHYQFDLVLDFSPRLETQIVSKLFLRARTITPAGLPRALEMLLDLGRGRRSPIASVNSDYANVLKQAGVKLNDTQLRVTLPVEEDARFEKRLKTSGSRGGELLVLLYCSNPLSGEGWPVLAFGEIGMRLSHNLNARIVAADEPSDATFTESLSSLLPTGSIKLAEPRALELVAAIARASLVITDDPAFANLASEFNTPVVEISDKGGAQAASPGRRIPQGASRRRVSTDEVFDLACEMIQESRSASLFKRP